MQVAQTHVIRTQRWQKLRTEDWAFAFDSIAIGMVKIQMIEVCMYFHHQVRTRCRFRIKMREVQYLHENECKISCFSAPVLPSLFNLHVHIIIHM